MGKTIVISERDNVAAVMENSKVTDFFIHRGDILLGDVYLASVENILPSIDAAFVHVGSDKMGFLHASDVTGKGTLQEKLKPKQKLIVQVVKEPTGHKGPRVTTSLSLPGRFLVLMPDEKGISISKKIVSPKERARLKSIVSLLKPSGVGVILRTEAEGQAESEIQEDLEFLLEKWNTLVTTADTLEPPNLISRDQDLLYRVIREACTEDVDELIVDTSFAMHRANQLLQAWNMNENIKVSAHKGMEPLLIAKGVDKEIRAALQTKVNLPSGGYLFIQTTEALTVVDVNSGKFTSSATQNETIRKTNMEAVSEIARQLRLRNIGGMIVVDFIDMDNRTDKLSILESFELALEPDKSKPQIGQLSDLGLVELTRHRQGQSLSEIFTRKCPTCSGNGVIIEGINFVSSPNETEYAAKSSKIKLPQMKQHQKRPMPQGNGKPFSGFKQQGIQTSPSVVASSKISEEQPKKEVELNIEEIKEFADKKGLTVPVSSAVRLASAPLGIVNKHLGDEFKKDVFVALSELESSDKEKSASQEYTQQAQQPVRPENVQQRQIRKPDFRQQRHYENMQRPIKRPDFHHQPQTEPAANIQQQQPRVEYQQQKLEENFNKPVIKTEAPQEVVIKKPEVVTKPEVITKPVVQQESDENAKKIKPPTVVKRRGRKPKSEVASTKKAKIETNDEKEI
ncbi:MAG: Rne/Rng family ribonuclease [Candidatus Gastranaerophilaceae bacterium]|jgi:ribonuclease E